MKIRNLISNTLAMTAAIMFFAACGGDTQTEVQQRAADQETVPAATEGEPIVITGNDQMRFSPTLFTVQAGAEVEILFRNIGRMPKETMGHNLVFLAKGANHTQFAMASMPHRDNEYVAPDWEDRVIAYTAVLGPGEEETLTFTAPEEPGDYMFVCSFPGHTPAGMTGIMRVE